ncbi:MAG: DUF5615 family PIN-like protein [Acidobacteria bacterium]|nr:DUF5615 family PIN-like protein [Acidobacteriota bacterium]
MRLLVDMNLSPRWIEFFHSSEFESVHWSSVGAANATDAEIMSYAHDHNFIVLTHDLDFSAMLAANHGDRPSVVQIRAEDLRPESIGKPVLAALRQMESELEAGALVTVDPKRTRIRILPL